MTDDFQIIKIVVPYADEVKLYPIADVHFGSVFHHEKAWMDFRDRIAGEENAYVVLVGDLVNNNIRSAVGSPFEDIVRPMEQKKIMVEMLKPLREKIVGAVSGNHEKRSLKEADDDVMYDIMSKLDLEDVYRQNTAYIHFAIGTRTTNKGNPKEKTQPQMAYNIGVTHGSGGGGMIGSAINKNERYAYTVEGLDLLITGHTHKGSITKPAKLVFDLPHSRMILKPFVCVQAVAWQNYGGYALTKMLSPTSTGADGSIVIKLSGRRNFKGITTEW